MNYYKQLQINACNNFGACKQFENYALFNAKKCTLCTCKVEILYFVFNLNLHLFKHNIYKILNCLIEIDAKY